MMKTTVSKSLLLIYVFCFNFLPAIAQSPERMTYQAVIRNSSDALITNTLLGMQISILQGSTSGTAVYVETHNPTTNANGLVSLEIGGGTVVSGDISSINWANGPYFIKIETDIAGGVNYTITSTSQLLSVPYALHAKTAENISGGLVESDPIFVAHPSFGINNANLLDWNLAFNWGNHATAGYLTSYTETDGLWSASPSFGITNSNITNWNTAFGWGNHATAGYLTSFTETDGLWSASPSFGITNLNITNWNTAFGWGNHATAGYLTSFTETDGLWSASPSFGITNSNITNWNTAFGWGNHATAGYLTSYTETDDIWSASPSFGITNSNITNWNTAFAWGNHATAGYLTNFTEMDPTIGLNTIGYSPKWDGTHLVAGAVFQDATGKVGIGNNNPGSTLDVSGGFIRVHSSDIVPSGNVDGLELGFFAAGGYAFLQGYNRGTNSFLPIEFSGSTVNFRTNGSTAMSVATNGNVGIGTLTPSQKFDVQGLVNAAGGFCINGDCISSWSSLSPWQLNGSNTYYNAGNVGIGTNTPNARLDLGIGYGASGEKLLLYNDDFSGPLAGTKTGFYLDRFSLQNNATFVFPTSPSFPGSYIVAKKNTANTTLVPLFTILGESGNVGIGTTTPSGLFHVEKTGNTLFKVGYDVTLSGMTNGGSGACGTVNISGGSDLSGTGTSGGSVTLIAGAWGGTDRSKIVLNAVGTGGTGGGLTISGGHSTAGSINVGRRTANGSPAGAVVIAGGEGGSNGNGGTVTLSGGKGTGDISYRGGDVVIKGGEGQSPSPAGNILFKIGDVEKARFNNDGKFGIGTTSPSADLEVNGDVKITGNFYAPGTVVQTIVETSEITSSLDVTSFTEANSDYRISFTPKYNNSIVLVEFNFSINTAMTIYYTVFHMQLVRNIGETDEIPVGVGPANGDRNRSSYVSRPNNGQDTNDQQNVYMVAKDSGLTPGTTYTYGFKYRREPGGAGTCHFNYSNGDMNTYGFSGVMTMKVTEIAQ